MALKFIGYGLDKLVLRESSLDLTQDWGSLQAGIAEFKLEVRIAYLPQHGPGLLLRHAPLEDPGLCGKGIHLR